MSWLDSDEIVRFPQRRLRCRVAALDDLTHDIRRDFGARGERDLDLAEHFMERAEAL